MPSKHAIPSLHVHSGARHCSGPRASESRYSRAPAPTRNALSFQNLHATIDFTAHTTMQTRTMHNIVSLCDSRPLTQARPLLSPPPSRCHHYLFLVNWWDPSIIHGCWHQHRLCLLKPGEIRSNAGKNFLLKSVSNADHDIFSTVAIHHEHCRDCRHHHNNQRSS